MRHSAATPLSRTLRHVKLLHCRTALTELIILPQINPKMHFLNWRENTEMCHSAFLASLDALIGLAF